MVKQPLIYMSIACPYAQRALIALEEAGVKHDRYEIDLQAKPSWYNTKVNPASKVPVLVLNPSDSAENGGGDESGETVKLPESLVIAEFVAEEYAQSGLLPQSAVERAQIRYYIERFSQLFTPAWVDLVYRGNAEGLAPLLESVHQFQSWLDPSGPFARGKQYTLLDLAVAPFIGRLIILSRRGLLDSVNAGHVHTLLTDGSSEGGKYKRLAEWWNAVSSRESWKRTFDEEFNVKLVKERLEKNAAERAQQAKQ